MFGGSSEELVMSLVKNKHLDATSLAALAAKLESEPPRRVDSDA
jgi:hypothetical protein